MPEGAIWVDTDMGFDDLAAICLADGAGRALAGLSTVAGNAPLRQVTANALAARAAFGWDVAIHDGADAPLTQPPITAGYVLGETGMPTAGRSLTPVAGRVEPDPATDAIARFVQNGGRDLLALGPLTNIAHLARTAPAAAGRLRITWMGGSAGPGNHTAAAEFNAAADPEAVAEMLAAGLDLRMVDLETCRQVTVDASDVAPLRALAGGRAALLADLMQGYVDISKTGRMALYDPVAAAALAAPDCVTFSPARIDAELTGTHTRGMTVVEWRARKAAPNAHVSRSADAPRIKELLGAGLAHAARKALP
ncbi:nucleoside hydrolase [Mesobaculum littorinae]|uniref:Nucleoside hydrolase n=1 Tax=Mesobaculum littorinae TaxID=2486419 RepID=A0A438AG69_9RHOB|nr:nucleoside hydrolase [Mesobaculum littorinae]RVV97706.1 nucleoside hydrolase [Mesobaculum littorinae]